MTATLSPLDALFLHTEDGISHMHIGSCGIFEGPAPTICEISELLQAKLHLLEHYRHRIRFVPMNLGHPVWVDDNEFDIAYHLRHTALPAPGGEAELENLMGRLMSQELDRRRPLWEAWVVEGLSGGRWALISKVHHCMVDGIAGTDMMAALLDTTRDADSPVPAPWVPVLEPSGLRLAVGAIAEMAMKPGRRLLAFRAKGFSPSGARRHVGQLVAGFRSLSNEIVQPMKSVSVEGLIGPNRRWAAGRCSLADVKEIRATGGGSVNDVVLAAITGAFRAVLLARGEQVDGVVLRTLVPVSIRAEGDHSANNQVSLLVAELPVGISDPIERLQAIHDQMVALKASHQAVAAGAIVAAAEFMPPPVFAFGAHALMGVLRRVPQAVVHTVTTNVPGPRQPLYALGREMLEYLPFVPLSEGVRIGIAIMSYNGHVAFGVTGDYDTAPDVHEMSRHIESEVALLRRATKRHATAKTAKRS
jgi:diacylglycerol O-acyltransferase / wax synthase